jgi:hypothetical protein
LNSGLENSTDLKNARSAWMVKGKNRVDEAQVAEFGLGSAAPLVGDFEAGRAARANMRADIFPLLVSSGIESGLEKSSVLKMRDPLFLLTRLVEGCVLSCQSQ